MTLPIVESVGESLTVGATASASSESGPDRPAQSLVASDLTEFSEGIFVKQTWSPDSKDEEPWVQLDLAAPAPISQIAIQEGKYGSASSVQAVHDFAASRRRLAHRLPRRHHRRQFRCGSSGAVCRRRDSTRFPAMERPNLDQPNQRVSIAVDRHQESALRTSNND